MDFANGLKDRARAKRKLKDNGANGVDFQNLSQYLRKELVAGIFFIYFLFICIWGDMMKLLEVWVPIYWWSALSVSLKFLLWELEYVEQICREIGVFEGWITQVNLRWQSVSKWSRAKAIEGCSRPHKARGGVRILWRKALWKPQIWKLCIGRH